MACPPPLYLLTVVVTTISGSFHFGFQIGAFNGASYHVKNAFNETLVTRYSATIAKESLEWLWSAFIATLFAGALFGTWLSTVLTPKYPNRTSLLGNGIVGLLASGLLVVGSFTPSIVIMFIARFILGAVVSFGFNIQTVYLMAISAPEQRGTANVTSTLTIQIGLVGGLIFALKEVLGTRDDWPYLAVIEAIVAAIHVVGVFFLCTDVPVDETKVVVDKMTLAQVLKHPTVRKGFLMGVFLNTTNSCSGINVLAGYSAQFLFKMFSAQQASAMAVGIAASSLIGVFTCTMIVERVGRRILLLVSYALCGLVHICIVITLAIDDTSHKSGWIFSVLMGVYLIVYMIGVGPVTMFITAELVPAEAVEVCQGIAVCAMLASSGILTLCFPPILEIVGSELFLVFVVFMVLSVIVTFFYLPETANRAHAEVDEDWQRHLSGLPRKRTDAVHTEEMKSVKVA